MGRECRWNAGDDSNLCSPTAQVLRSAPDVPRERDFDSHGDREHDNATGAKNQLESACWMAQTRIGEPDYELSEQQDWIEHVDEGVVSTFEE